MLTAVSKKTFVIRGVPTKITRRFPYVRSIKCNKQKNKDKYAAEKADIAEILDRNKGIYGYRRITEQLKKKGYSINHKTVFKVNEKP